MFKTASQPETSCDVAMFTLSSIKKQVLPHAGGHIATVAQNYFTLTSQLLLKD